MPRAGQWTILVKRLGGAVILAMSAYYFFKMGQVW
jgi:hypothetical protein